jgi:predicted chitinase
MRLSRLLQLTSPVLIDQLNKPQLAELQQALLLLGHPAGPIDGFIGSRTRTAWSEFAQQVGAASSLDVDPASLLALDARLAAIDLNRSRINGGFANVAATINAIKDECSAHGLGMPEQIAYVLATTQWETNHTYKPVREAYFLRGSEASREAWRASNLRYFPYYGRGYVQLTWKDNYKLYGKLLDLDLVEQPDTALQPAVALFVLVHGFKTGGFTGRKISDYIRPGLVDFVAARRCINGSDRAQDIAQLAQTHLAQL